MKIDKRTKTYRHAVENGLTLLRKWAPHSYRTTLPIGEQREADEVTTGLTMLLAQLDKAADASTVLVRAKKEAARLDERVRENRKAS